MWQRAGCDWGGEDGVEVLGNNKKKITISDGKERIF